MQDDVTGTRRNFNNHNIICDRLAIFKIWIDVDSNYQEPERVRTSSILDFCGITDVHLVFVFAIAAIDIITFLQRDRFS